MLIAVIPMPIAGYLSRAHREGWYVCRSRWLAGIGKEVSPNSIERHAGV
jgi:hypothetical protein